MDFQTSYFSAKTNVVVFEHKWVIENMVNIYKKCDKTLHEFKKTDTFNTRFPYLKTKFVPIGSKAKDINVKFKLYCYPYGTDKNNDENMFLVLKLDSCSIDQVIIQFKFSVLDKNGTKFCIKGKR